MYGLEAVKRLFSCLDKALEAQSLQLQSSESSNVREEVMNSHFNEERLPKNKRQRCSPDDQDVPKERESRVVTGKDPPNQRRDGEDQEGPNSKRSRKLFTPDARDASNNQNNPSQNQSPNNMIEKKNAKNGTSSNGGGEKEPSDKGEAELPNSDADSDIVVVEAATRPVVGNRKSPRAACTSNHTQSDAAKCSSSSQISLSTKQNATSSAKPLRPRKSLKSQHETKSQPSDIHPPTTLPPPIDHVYMFSTTFLGDHHPSGPSSGSLQPRHPCMLTYDAGFRLDGSGSCLDYTTFVSVRERLERWDPYWKVVKEFGHKQVRAADNCTMTLAATRTSSCNQPNTEDETFPKSCAVVTVDLPTELVHARQVATSWGVEWGKTLKTYRTGDKRLLLRMLPLKRSEKDKKGSDTHKWPIGTFLQLLRGSQNHVLHLQQRRQQSHDPRLWKGLCHPLDLTPIPNLPSSPFGLKICTREVIEAWEWQRYKVGTPVSKLFEDENGKMRPFAGKVTHYDAKFMLYKILYEDGDAEELTQNEVKEILVNKDDVRPEEGRSLLGSYAIHLAVCEYIEPDDLYHQVLDEIPKLSLESSKRQASRYLESQIVSIDSDNEGDAVSNRSSLTLSLLDPISKVAIGTPVRGSRCKHMQCFDLKIWLQSNKHISGGRWRCGVCEDFISVKDLVRCGLFEAMLHDYRDKVSGVRDKVSFKPDGSWCLKEENKLRYSSKNRSSMGGNGSSGGKLGEGHATTGINDSSRIRSAQQSEVIDLL